MSREPWTPVIVEVSGFGVVAKRVSAQVQGQDEISLLHDLFTIQIHIGKVEQQWVLIGGGVQNPTPGAW